MAISARCVLVLPLVAALVACTGDSSSERTATGAANALATTTATDPAPPLRSEGICPLTLPNRSVPPGVADWTAEESYGDGRLWTQFWPHNVVIVSSDFVRKGGAIEMKWPWWRGVRGELSIEGRRVDGDAKPLTAEIPHGYGLSGFQPSGILFPTEGCWEVTGRVGDASLTFVTLVLKASTYLLEESVTD